MTFRRYGRSRQLRIRGPRDFGAVLELDDARWAATGAPIEGINLDPRFLGYLDADGNRRIMVFEVRAAVAWALHVFADSATLSGARDSASCGSIAAGYGEPTPAMALAGDLPDRESLRRSFERVLLFLHKPPSDWVSLSEVRHLQQEIAARPVSASGVVLPEAVDEPSLREFVADAISATGGVPHPSGAPGLDIVTSERFVAGVRAYREWRGSAPTDVDASRAYELFRRLSPKVDQHFLLCRTAALDERVARRAYPSDAEIASMEIADGEGLNALLSRMPLGPPGHATPCALLAEHVVNPVYSSDFAEFLSLCATVDGGPRNAIDERRWTTLKAFFAGYGDWVRRKPDIDFSRISADRLASYADGAFDERFAALADEVSHGLLSLAETDVVERFLLYQMYLLRFVNNFVSFPDLYDSASRAAFEMGSLVMDGRYFHLAVLVRDHARHLRIAKLSNMYLMYVAVRSSAGAQKYEVAVPVTAGRVGNLCVGKRGVFHDVFGSEYDAEVMEIVENPVSVLEAMLQPFRRIGTMITSKIESLSQESEKRLDAVTGQAVGDVYTSAQSSAATGAATAGGTPGAQQMSSAASGSAASVGATAPGSVPAQTSSAVGVAGILAGGGVAIAAIGSAVAYLTSTLAKLPWWQILIGIFGAVFAVLIPTTIVALIKLARRDMSSILEGSGWAVNTRMRLSPRLSRFFTQYPKRRFAIPDILRVRVDADTTRS